MYPIKGHYNIRIPVCSVQNRKIKFYDSAHYKLLALMYTYSYEIKAFTSESIGFTGINLILGI